MVNVRAPFRRVNKDVFGVLVGQAGRRSRSRAGEAEDLGVVAGAAGGHGGGDAALGPGGRMNEMQMEVVDQTK
jgi:hypothetical protein